MTDHKTPAALPDVPFHYELLEVRTDEDCGCPEELWLMGDLEVTLHLEKNGQGHIHLDNQHWEDDKFVACNDLVDLKIIALNWLATFPQTTET